MGDKAAVETLRVNVPRSVASPAAKGRKKTPGPTPAQIDIGEIQRPAKRKGSGKGPTKVNPPGIGGKDPVLGIPVGGAFSHKPGHVRRRKQSPAQKRASMANLKKARAARR